jgi:hypothetical protein
MHFWCPWYLQIRASRLSFVITGRKLVGVSWVCNLSLIKIQAPPHLIHVGLLANASNRCLSRVGLGIFTFYGTETVNQLPILWLTQKLNNYGEMLTVTLAMTLTEQNCTLSLLSQEPEITKKTNMTWVAVHSRCGLTPRSCNVLQGELKSFKAFTPSLLTSAFNQWGRLLLVESHTNHTVSWLEGKIKSNTYNVC